MKIKSIAFSGFMASILMAGAAYAAGEVPTLATDQYVIQGVDYAISQAGTLAATAKSEAIAAAASDATDKAGAAQTAAEKTAADALKTHTDNTTVHITAEERTAWNEKQAAITENNKLSAGLVSGLATVATSGKASDLNNDLNFQSADDVTAAIGRELSDHDVAPEAHSDIREDISGLQDAADALEDGIEGLNTEINAENTGLKARMTAAETSITNKANAADVYTKTEVNGLLDDKQDTIDSDHKLSAGLVDGLAVVATTGAAANITEDATHRFVTDTEKSTWNAKQDAISDLETIRSGAAAGASALQADDLKCSNGYCLLSESGALTPIATISENTDWVITPSVP